jgi:hypothetical protein
MRSALLLDGTTEGVGKYAAEHGVTEQALCKKEWMKNPASFT